MHLWFFVISTIVGFFARLTNSGFILLLFGWVFVVILIFDLYLGLKIAKVAHPTGHLVKLTWMYSWVQLGMFLLQEDGGSTGGEITIYSVLHFLRLWPGYQPELLYQIGPLLQLLSIGLLIPQIKLYVLILANTRKELIKKPSVMA